jgi:hypothetical protein
MPEWWADRVKIVALPRGANDVRLTERPPEGSRMAVA